MGYPHDLLESEQTSAACTKFCGSSQKHILDIFGHVWTFLEIFGHFWMGCGASGTKGFSTTALRLLEGLAVGPEVMVQLPSGKLRQLWKITIFIG